MFSDAATIWMSIKAMNWPNAMMPKMRYLRASLRASGLIGAAVAGAVGRAPVKEAVLAMSVLLPRREDYIICII